MAFSRLPEISRPGPFHNIGRSPARSQFSGHKPHVGIYVAEEVFISLAEIVKSGIALGRLEGNDAWGILLYKRTRLDSPGSRGAVCLFSFARMTAAGLK